MDVMVNMPMLDMVIPVVAKAVGDEPGNPYLKFLGQWLTDTKRLLNKKFPDLMDDDEVFLEMDDRVVERLHDIAKDVELKALTDNRVADAIKIADFRSSLGAALLMDVFHGKGW